MITSYLGLCNVCAGKNPRWEVVRVGDVLVRPACDEHLARICASMQRDSELTRLTVEDRRKRKSEREGSRP